MAIKSLLDEGKSQRLGGVVIINRLGTVNPKRNHHGLYPLARKDVLGTKSPFDEL